MKLSYLLVVGIFALSFGFIGCDTDDEGDATDTKQEEAKVEVAEGPCIADNLCNTVDCGGGKPKAWGANTDPDCNDTACNCNYNPNICEPASKGSTDACACDWDCQDADPCSKDGHCDLWCPKGTDLDCPDCDCDYNQNVCEAAVKCSTTICDCDIDCAEGAFLPCSADNHCDSWCPTDADPDCANDPDKNGKYCT